jgi:hypothetical protein
MTPIRPHDVFVAPGFLVGEEQIFAEQRPLETRPGALANLIVETRPAALRVDLGLDEVLHMTCRENFLNLLADRSEPRSLAFGRG